MRTRRRRLARAAGAGCLLVAAVLAWYPSAASGEDGGSVKSGWWSQAQAAPVTAPLGQVTGGDLEVGNDPAGPNAVAAVSATAPPDAAGITLTLKLATGQSAGTAAVEACPTLSSWQPADGGSWDARPTASCSSGKAPGVATSDGATVTFRLGAELARSPGNYDVVIVPREGDTDPFLASFTRPDASSVAVTPGTASSPADAGAGAAEPSPSIEPSFDTGGAASPAIDLGASPAIDAAPAPTPPTTATTVAPLKPSASARGTATSLASPPVVRRILDRDRPERLMAVGLLAALGLALWWFGGSPVRPPRLLGSLAADAAPVAEPVKVAGIGRFARPRDRAPRPI